MRADPTPYERQLWHFLRQRPLGFKFRRQVPIDRFIVDFACFAAKLVVEVDGRFHAKRAGLRLRGYNALRSGSHDF